MSNELIITSEDAYMSFLDGIRQTSQVTVVPAVFNRIINRNVVQWVKNKLPLVEFSQKRIDDLDILRIDTGSPVATQVHASSYPVIASTTAYVFPIPTSYDAESSGMLMDGDYPLYMHGLNALFRIDADDEWDRARIMRSDQRAVNMERSYRIPSNDRLYYEKRGTSIILIGSTLSHSQLRLEYIRYPKKVVYSATAGDNINPEFSPSQNKEIVDQTIREFLERKGDPRYKSFLNEEMINQQGN
ncbi:MAG: hypothetical protein H8E51_08645 [Bacteroidetes bacterium]|nr:hypothetical protein [Bacteroidota bacterium]